jgi:predicted lipoprotein
MKKIYRYLLLFVAFAFLAYHSVYFKKLSEVRAMEEPEVDFTAMADSLYNGILQLDEVVSLKELMSNLRTQPDSVFQAYGNRLGIGNSAYFFIKTSGTISQNAKGQITLRSNSPTQVQIDTKYIFGNALRDASGLVQLTDFKTTSAFNQLSEALNSLVRETVLPPVVEQLAAEDSIMIKGAVRLGKKDLSPSQITIIPVQISLY